MTAPARRRAARRPREERRSEILDAAAKVFCERGYQGAAMAEIANRLDLVEGAIYKHFETKRELLNRVLERWYERLHDETERHLAGIRGDRERLRYLVWRHLRALADDPQMCRLIFTEVRSEAAYLESELHRLNKRYTELLMGVLKGGVRSGAFRKAIAPALVRDMIYGGIEHHVWGYLYGGRPLDADTLADRIVDLVCEGIDRRAVAAEVDPQTERLAGLVSRLERTIKKTGGLGA
ncbi:MAG TPA: TetR/AcrR family transcriptional regulator [Nevskiaceae bacterium]|nr:TetR/AcrR family transcriptional regulator [Nevskiaceae bacterium]